MNLLLFFAGLVLLVVGAEALVRGASRMAALLKVPPIVVGLLVVGYGTSTPELGVSVSAALAGQPDVALGTVVGSNTFNVLFILGVSALIAPLTVSSRLVRLDVPVMIGVSVLLFLMALDAQVGHLDGALLLAGLVGYTAFTLLAGRSEAEASSLVRATSGWRAAAGSVLLIVLGLAALVAGARWFVDGAVSLAETLGISPLVVGMVVVAAGTSLPEVVTSIVATVRGDRDIAVGNVVGSNIFNVLGVQGAASVAASVRVAPEALLLDLPLMIAVAVACLPIFFTGYKIARWEGMFFLALFAAYGTYRLLASFGPDSAPTYLAVMTFLVTPIVAVTLGVLAYREWRRPSS